MEQTDLQKSVNEWAKTRWADYRSRYAENTESICLYLKILQWKFPHRLDLAAQESERNNRLSELRKYDELVKSIIAKSASV